MEHFEGEDAEELFNKYGVHPERSGDDSIFCTTGSLGLGLPIAVGAAMATNSDVHCIISDGECCEGSIWESLYYLSKKPLSNLKIYVNVNGFSAYDIINITKLEKLLKSFEIDNLFPINTSHHLKEFKFLDDKAIEAHYCKITNEEILKELKYKIV
jgi:transketolase